LTFPKTCFNPTCNCKELKIVREVTLRCSNCHCGVKVEQIQLGDLREPEALDMMRDNILSLTQPEVLDMMRDNYLLFTVVKDRKDSA
jgi:hypothetical protein